MLDRKEGNIVFNKSPLCLKEKNFSSLESENCSITKCPVCYSIPLKTQRSVTTNVSFGTSFIQTLTGLVCSCWLMLQ